MKIVSVDKVVIYPEHLNKLKKLGKVIVYNDVPSENEGIKRIRDADIVIDNWFLMPARVIANCPNLKMISVAATGYEWVDINEAKKRKIIVCNSPEYGTGAVAEHTISLMLSAVRLMSFAENDFHRGNWDPIKFKGIELGGKTLGIIGYGHIGRRVGEICRQGFGMKILFTNSQNSQSDLEKLLKESDIISINAPLTNTTKNMIGRKEFNLMKKGVVIVNTGRGAIIDEKAFIDNLQSGKIFAAGIDVYNNEPIKDKNYPLFKFPNVVVTPHIGFNTQESEYKLSDICTQNVINFFEGKPQNVVA